MLKSVLLRLWQQLTQGLARSQANDPVDEVDDFRELYQKILIAKAKELGHDIQSVENDPGIDRMDTAVWAGSDAERLGLGTYVEDEDFESIIREDWPTPPKDISASEQFKKNPKLQEAYYKAVEAYKAAINDHSKHLDD